MPACMPANGDNPNIHPYWLPEFFGDTIMVNGKVWPNLDVTRGWYRFRLLETGLKASGIKFGALADDPIKAVSCVGDPMVPAFAGLVIGAAGKVPVLMAGGTQIGAIAAVINALKPDVLDNVAMGTTRWIIADKTADLKGIVAQIADIPIMAADLSFGQSRFEGLRAYEAGVVKEGVGAGGASIAAILKSEGSITKEILLKEIEKNYEQLMGLK